MRRAEVLAILGEHRYELRREHAVASMALFGLLGAASIS
jgi:hypothetical protein